MAFDYSRLDDTELRGLILHLVRGPRFLRAGLRTGGPTELPRSAGNRFRPLEAVSLAAQILTDLRYIQAKTSAGMVESLLEDYDVFMGGRLSGIQYSGSVIPQVEVVTKATSRFRDSRPSKRPHAVLEEVMDPSGVSVAESKYAQILSFNPNRSPYSTPITSLSRATGKEVKAFAYFVQQHAHIFERFPGVPLLCVQQAYCSERSGYLYDAASAIIKKKRNQSALILEEEISRSSGGDSSPVFRTRNVSGAGFRSVAMTPDGQVACSGGDDRLLRIWDVSRLRCLRIIDAGARLFKVRISIDARFVIGVDDLGRLHRWDLRDESRHLVIPAHEGHALACCMTPEGRFAMTGGYDKHVKLWELDTGILIRDLYQPGQGRVNCVAIASDGQMGLSGHSIDAQDRNFPKTIVVWDLAKGHPVSSPYVMGSVSSVVLEPGTGAILCGNRDGQIQIIERGAEGPGIELRAHERAITAVELGHKAGHLFTASQDGFVKLWDWRRKRLLSVFHSHLGGVADLAVAIDGAVAASVGAHDQTIRVWDQRVRHQPRGARYFSEPLQLLRILPAHGRVIAGARERLSIIESRTGKELIRHEYPGPILYAPQIDSHSGRYLCYEGPGARFVVDAKQSRHRRAINRRHPVAGAELFPGGQHGFVYHPDDNVLLWGWSSGKSWRSPLRTWHSEDGLRNLDDNRFVLVTGKDDVLRVADIITGAYQSAIPLRKDENKRILCRDGRFAVVPTKSDVLRGIDLVTGAIVLELNGTAGQFEHCLLTASGLRLVTYEDRLDTSLFHVWDLMSCTRLRTFSQWGPRIRSVQLAPDATILLALYDDDTVRILDIESGHCAAVFYGGRGLSEVSQLLPNGRFVAGCRTGHLIFLQLTGLANKEPMATPVRRWTHSTRGRPTGWERHLSVTCPWCGVLTIVGSRAATTIYSVGHQTRAAIAGRPSWTIPQKSWHDKRLVSCCRSCGRRIRLTPFVIDRSRGYRECQDERMKGSITTRRVVSDLRQSKSRCLACGDVLKETPLLVGYDGSGICKRCLQTVINRGPADKTDLREMTCCICKDRKPLGWKLNGLELCFNCGTVSAEQIAYQADISSWAVCESIGALKTHSPMTQRVTAILRQSDIRSTFSRKTPGPVAQYLDGLVNNLGFENANDSGGWVRSIARDACIAVGRPILPFLLAHHRHPSWRLRAYAAFAAARIDSNDVRTRKILQSAVTDVEPQVRSWVPQSLIYCQGRWSRKLLDSILSDANEDVRQNAWRVVNLWDDLAGRDTKGDRGLKHILESFEAQGLTDEHRRGCLMSLEGRRSTWSRKTKERLTRELTSNSPGSS